MDASQLSRAHEAYDEHRWAEALALFKAASQVSPLDPPDAERMAEVGYLLGEKPVWAEAWERAYEGYRELGEHVRAARCALWLGFNYMNGGEAAHGGGWLGRAQHIVSEACPDSAEAGFLLLPGAIMICDTNPRAAYESFSQALEIGQRFEDNDLVAMAHQGLGRCLIRMGEAVRGMALLDEVLLGLSASRLSPIITGVTYCGAIEACHEASDPQRAMEWTEALTHWCDEHPDMIAYRGQCLVYRAALAQMQGAWADAFELATDACRRLSEPTPHPALSAAHYLCAEIERLRGALARAERAYALASEHGRDPQPGMALLRLMQGDIGTAASSVRRLLEEARDPLPRSKVLAPAVEVLLAAGEYEAAESALRELEAVAQQFGSQLLAASVAYCEGAVALANGEVGAGIGPLRRAQATWAQLRMPYEVALSRALIAQAYRDLGDSEGARIEMEAARRTFQELGAEPELIRLAGDGSAAPGEAHHLTPRELEILRLVASGKTNRAISEQLVISEKTVARHVSNIFNKLGVSSRSAATAYAYDHKLL